MPAVTELVVAELMYLQWVDPKEPIYLYINSTGTTRDDGETVRFAINLSLYFWDDICLKDLYSDNLSRLQYGILLVSPQTQWQMSLVHYAVLFYMFVMNIV